MKKIYTLIGCLALSLFSKAQTDTLLFENFDVDPTANYLLYMNGNDTNWIDFDDDVLADNTPALGPNWVWSEGFIGSNDSTGCMLSNSWFNPPGVASNYLITPPIQISDTNSVLSWKSAPYQTPYYLDGYQVVVSTLSNYPYDFTDTLFVAAEYVSGASANGGNYSAYTFSPGFVHGLDGTYIEYDTDSSRLAGVLRPFSVSLAQYVGQTIYISFHHNSNDDNLLAVDDILVTGGGTTGITEIETKGSFTVSPNPASNRIELGYYLPSTANVLVSICDLQGKEIFSESKGMQIKGNQKSYLDVKALSSGNYIIRLIAGKKEMLARFTKVSE